MRPPGGCQGVEGSRPGGRPALAGVGAQSARLHPDGQAGTHGGATGAHRVADSSGISTPMPPLRPRPAQSRQPTHLPASGQIRPRQRPDAALHLPAFSAAVDQETGGFRRASQEGSESAHVFGGWAARGLRLDRHYAPAVLHHEVHLITPIGPPMHELCGRSQQIREHPHVAAPA